MSFIHRIVALLKKPFVENLEFFLCIWLLASIADVYFWTIHGNPVFGIYMGVHGFIHCYLIVFILGLFPNIISKILRIILLALGYINMAADAMVHNIMHFSFTGDMVAIILGSNAQEASEFLPMYLTPSVLAFIGVSIILSIVILKFGSKIIPLMKKGGAILGLLFLLCGITIVTIRNSNNWEGLFLNKISLFLKYDRPVDLRQYRSSPVVSVTEEQPENIVLIVGESLSRSHCSLYGYEKPTQPRLQSMLNDSLITLYSNVEAAYTSTVESFKSMFSTYSPDLTDEEWYTSNTFLFDVMNAGGYTTYWISNQSSAGLYDNVVARIAQLADSTIWVGTQGLGIGKHDLDELTIPVVKSVAQRNCRKFIVVHLMGSHEGFSGRYPANFAKFKAQHYPDKPENQRQLQSEYDNSILYNDSIVAQLIQLFDTNSSVVIYLPDHGLDIFETDPEYAGHARPQNPESFKAGVEIPFIITNPFSSSYNKDEYFNATNIFQYICDIAKISISEEQP